MAELSGNWVGELGGTNTGVFAISLQHEGDRVYGLGRFYEPSLGSYEYNIQGIASLPDVSLFLTPKPNQPFNLGKVEVRAALNQKGQISGTWKSDIRTEGRFQAQRQPEESEEEKHLENDSVFIIHGHDEGTSCTVRGASRDPDYHSP